MKKNLMLMSIMMFLFSCGTNNNTPSKAFLVESTGSPYEVVVVCNDDVWDTYVGDTVKNVFQEPEMMLNYPEGKFRVIRKRDTGFKGIFKKHRNVVYFRIDSTMSDEKPYGFGVSFDQWAKPQIVISLKAKNLKFMNDIFLKKENEILRLLDNTEQSRFAKKLKQNSSVKLDSIVRNTVNVGISLHKSYMIKKAVKPNFIWLSYEMPLSSQGVIIYTYPYTGQKIDAKEVQKMRNEYVKQVPGQMKDSYMQTSDTFEPITQKVIVNDREWVKMSGFWNVEKDFMGGPFRNFTTIDVANNRVVCVDLYVYSPEPSKGQRNYIKQLNSIINTIRL